MTNERRANRATTTRTTSNIGFIFASALFLMLSTATLSHANIHSPQGALDVASALPGKYAFLNAVRQAPPKAEPAQPAPAVQQAPLAEEGDDDETGPTSINELIELMRQATEASAMIAEGEKSKRPATAVASLAAIPGLDETMRIVAQVPKYKAANALALMKARKFLWPVDGFIYSAFNATRGRRAHGAIDIVAAKGTPVAVAADGVVSVVANGGKNFSGYGKIVIVDHGQGVHTVYAHLDSFLVKMGQRVQKGQYIATVGRTGRVTTNLLHYEVRVAGKKIDPLTCMEERPGVVKMVNYKSGKK